jgi:hypothetical protein
MFVSSQSLPHIAFARAEAARQAGQLAWILEHEGQISMSSEYELGVLELIVEQDPEHKLKGSAKFVERVKARGDRRELGR